MIEPNLRGAGVAAGVLLASAATLVCCVLPVVLVSLGAGATLVSLLTAFPQLVWLSEHKGLVFGFVAVCLLLGGLAQRYARRQPCPTDPVAARTCTRWRRIGAALYGMSLAVFATGAGFAYLLPRMG